MEVFVAGARCQTFSADNKGASLRREILLTLRQHLMRRAPSNGPGKAVLDQISRVEAAAGLFIQSQTVRYERSIAAGSPAARDMRNRAERRPNCRSGVNCVESAGGCAGLLDRLRSGEIRCSQRHGRYKRSRQIWASQPRRSKMAIRDTCGAANGKNLLGMHNLYLHGRAGDLLVKNVLND